MDMSDYVVQLLAAERLTRAREDARRRALVASSVDRPLRVRVGEALIALGQRLLGTPAAQRTAS
jgi:hypothetical protein